MRNILDGIEICAGVATRDLQAGSTGSLEREGNTAVGMNAGSLCAGNIRGGRRGLFLGSRRRCWLSKRKASNYMHNTMG